MERCWLKRVEVLLERDMAQWQLAQYSRAFSTTSTERYMVRPVVAEAWSGFSPRLSSLCAFILRRAKHQEQRQFSYERLLVPSETRSRVRLLG